MNKKNLAIVVLGLVTAMAAQAAEVKWNGDFRFRHEFVKDNAANNDTAYNRERVSLRMGSIVQVNDASMVEFRLATGNGLDSAFTTLGGSGTGGKGAFPATLGNIGINLDRAYFAYTGVSNLTLAAGRVKNGFYFAGGNDMLFSTDLNFDAVGASYKLPVGDFTIMFNGAQVWVNENETSSVDDTTMSAVQVAARHKVGDLDYSFGVGYYNVNQDNLASSLGGEFKMIDLGLDMYFKVAELPLMVFADYVTNGSAVALADGEKHATGMAFGAKVGAWKKAGDWAVGYDYRNVKANAVLSGVDSPDSLNSAGTTDGAVHRVKASYTIAEGFTASLAGILGKATTVATTPVEKNKNKFQFDLSFAL